MIDIQTNDFPPFLVEEFERMLIPGEETGFAISYSSGKQKDGIACGLQGNVAICMSYSGDEYAVVRRVPIAFDVFDSLRHLVPDLVKHSGFIGADDILDGESYLVKWASGPEKTRLVLSNPRDVDDVVKQLAGQLDKLMNAARRAKEIPERLILPATTSPLQSSTSRDIVE